MSFLLSTNNLLKFQKWRLQTSRATGVRPKIGARQRVCGRHVSLLGQCADSVDQPWPLCVGHIVVIGAACSRLSERFPSKPPWKLASGLVLWKVMRVLREPQHWKFLPLWNDWKKMWMMV
ncbi:hypothetical protein Lal_00016985 [Lupinus albus]|nr:hypothetical protein Lal_00016985 [Lupinus albus]